MHINSVLQLAVIHTAYYFHPRIRFYSGQKIRTLLKTFLNTAGFIVLLSLFSFSPLPAPGLPENNKSFIDAAPVNPFSPLYDKLNLDEQGLSQKAFDAACTGYQQLLEEKTIAEPGYLVICDFSQSSKKKRFYLLDMAGEQLVKQTYVAHGKNSGSEYATRFSNKPQSLQSSLGFYITRHTYYGQHGLSLRLDGLEKGFNDKAMARNIVVHGADYIEEKWLQQNNSMGRSFGCPALPRDESKEVISLISNGACLFIYHPAGNYLNNSKLLND